MRKKIITQDGSSSIYHTKYDEPYHSQHGAVAESKYVFIEKGLRHIYHQKQEIHLFEMGFGTGLNAFLTYLFAVENPKVSIYYTTIEAEPLETEWAGELHYPQTLAAEAHQLAFEQLHTLTWEEEHPLLPNFHFTKKVANLLTYSPQSIPVFDLIYYDAFAPSSQPELWTLEVFQRLYQMMKPQSCLVTYCAKGEVRRAMQAAGFLVEKLPGPPRKREMLRANKPMLDHENMKAF